MRRGGSTSRLDRITFGNYSYYMKPIELKIARIGNSRGVRIPAATLDRYELEGLVIMEERSDGILLRPPGPAQPKLSWENTAREMANDANDAEIWVEWDNTVGDGLDTIPWEPPAFRRIAEPPAEYKPRRRPRNR